MNLLSGKKILITGATGLLGSNLTIRMLNADNVVYIMGRSRKRMESVFIDYVDNSNFSIIEHDVAEKWPDMGDFDFIFHAAGPIAGKIIKEKPVSVIMPNIVGTMNCLNYLNNQKKRGRMMVFSSATVYANSLNVDKTVTEDETSIADTLHAPNAPYSESKRMVEVIANAYHKQYGTDVVISRFGYIYGYTKQVPDTALYSFIKKVIEGEDILINNPNTPRRDNIYVEDAVDGLISLCTDGISGETYNISSGGDLNNFASIDEIALAIQKAINDLIVGNNTKVGFNMPQGKRNPGIILSNKKLKTTGWSVGTSLVDGVYETVKSYIK